MNAGRSTFPALLVANVAALPLLILLAQAALGQSTPKGSLAGLGQESVTVDANTETVIRGALKYLASKQNANGSWVTGDGDSQPHAMTGYALVAFMTAGQLPDEGEYGRNVTAGMNYLLNSIRADGIMGSNGHYMYGHGIASIALAEMYGQTREPRIRAKLEQVIHLIIKCQNDKGGWRYQPQMADDDISVTVLQIVALRAAKNAGLEVPQATMDRAVKYVRSCYHQRSGGFTYQPRGGEPGFARTAAAIYSLQVCGEYDDPRVKTGSDYLFQKRDDRQWFAYGHFYAAPAQYMIGGEAWPRWYQHVKGILLANVKHQGELSWWEPKFNGDRGAVFCTSIYTTILAMPYHYLPLYQR